MYIASSSTTVKFHSFPDGELIYNYQPGSKVVGPIKDISWSKDGSWLSLVPKSGLAEVISVRNQLKLIHTVVDVEEPTCTAFQNTTKKFIAFGSKNGQVLVYDIKSKGVKNWYPKASSQISHIEFTARDTHLVAGCLNGEVLLYSNLTYGLSSTYKIPKSKSISALRTNPSKRNFIIGGSNEGVVVVWDTNINKHKFYIESHKAPITGVAFSPINSDLILSTGADRQFCCYDIVSNKCIASVPVNNNMIAVDFSHDGTHFIMASQEGNICIYDSRRILEPIFTFEAHKNSIKNISFQKQEFSASTNSFVEDKVVPEQNLEDENDNQSFNVFLENYPEAKSRPNSEIIHQLETVDDSFMVAMGLGNGNSMKKEKSCLRTLSEAWDDCKNFSPIPPNENISEKPLYQSEKKPLFQKQMSTSTPTCPVPLAPSKLENLMSPIVQQSGNPTEIMESEKIPKDEIKNLIEDIVKKEMSEFIDKINYEMKYQFHLSNKQTRQMYLNMGISMVKDSIKIENSINSLRQDFAASSPMSENYLLEENLKLKKQIAVLEQQLSKMELTNGDI